MAILDLPTNPTLVVRNQQRADERKQQMGTTYLMHPANRVTRLSSHTNFASIGSVLTRPKGGVR